MKTLFKIIKFIVTIILIVILCMVVFQKITKSKLVIGNFYIFQVASKSMLPDYKVGDVIVVRKVDVSKLKVGDDVSYVANNLGIKGICITHRIIDIRVDDDSNKYYFITKGLANDIEDPEISEDDLYGKVVYHTVLFSFIGRLMTNIVIYYILFIAIGVGISYDIISSFIFKRDDE